MKQLSVICGIKLRGRTVVKPVHTLRLRLRFSLSLPSDANVKCEHQHLLPLNPFLKFGANANADVNCEQGLRVRLYYVKKAKATSFSDGFIENTVGHIEH